jgi:hypothetical protein
MTLSPIRSKQLTETIPFAIASLALMTFFCYTDEGYYSFAWVSDPMSVLGVVLVSAILVAGQMLVHKVVLKRYLGVGKRILSFILGTILSFVGLFLLVFLVYAVQSLVTGNWG